MYRASSRFLHVPAPCSASLSLPLALAMAPALAHDLALARFSGLSLSLSVLFSVLLGLCLRASVCRVRLSRLAAALWRNLRPPLCLMRCPWPLLVLLIFVVCDCAVSGSVKVIGSLLCVSARCSLCVRVLVCSCSFAFLYIAIGCVLALFSRPACVLVSPTLRVPLFAACSV